MGVFRVRLSADSAAAAAGRPFAVATDSVRQRTDVAIALVYAGPSCFFNAQRESTMGTILLVILILALIGVFPTWPHSRNWGYGPSGLAGLVLIILVIMLLTGRL